LYFEGDYKRSATVLRQALAIDQSSYQVWGNLASALELAGQREEALSAYKEAKARVLERIRVNPRDASLHLALADYDAALGDSSQAPTSLTAALALTPTDSHTLFQVAVFYEQRLKQRGVALDWLAKAIAAGQTWREIDRSPTLRALREDPRFLKLRQAR
jgi:tetratricopeptide (TPR) repeat protein